MFTPTPVTAPEEPIRVVSASLEVSGVLHHPSLPARGAVLLCPADGEERAWCLRTYVELSRALAKRGYWSLRFDYLGQGESDGVYEESSMESRLDDTTRMLAFLRERTRFEAPFLIGARLGGTIALEAAATDPRIGGVVLCEPVMHPDTYATNLLRVNLTMQMVMHKRVIRPTEELMNLLSKGGRVSANGYTLTGPFLAELGALRPAAHLAALGKRSMVFVTPSTRLPHSAAEVAAVPFAPFWKEPKGDITPPRALIVAAVEWIDNTTREVGK